MNKKIFTTFIFVFAFTAVLTAQQITRFAVVDTAVVYQTYFREWQQLEIMNLQKLNFKQK